MKREIDTPAVDELVLYCDNTEHVYNRFLAIARNLLRKMRKGTYDHKRAAKAFRHLTDDAARSYNTELGTGKGGYGCFGPRERQAAAEEIRDSFAAEAKLGNYDHLLA